MTGKEALDELMETFYELCEECDCNEDMYQKHNLTSPHHIIRKELDELTKYKRAFEILKEELNIELGKEEHTFKDFKDIYYYMSIKPAWQDIKTTFELSQNEYELIEELMRDEN